MKGEEQRIIYLLKQGDNIAYKYIYDNLYSLLCSIAYEYIKDTFIAITIVDDLIFHIWEKRDSITITISLQNYLVRSVRNRCINYLNLEREKKEVSFSNTNFLDKKKLYDSENVDYPLATLLENELENKIYESIENLPQDCKKVFKMSRFEEKSYDQIANELSLSVNTVKYHMKNALSRLSRDLSKYLLIVFYWIIHN